MEENSLPVALVFLKSRSHERENYGKNADMNHGFTFGKKWLCAEERRE